MEQSSVAPLLSPAARSRLTSRAAMASTTLAVMLLGLKIWSAIATGSVSMLGSLADTALDILASLVTLYAVRLAAEPADDQHGFGHGKAEAIAALFQTFLIVTSAIGIAWRGFSELGAGHEPARPELGIAVSLFAIAGTLALVTYQRHITAVTCCSTARSSSLWCWIQCSTSAAQTRPLAWALQHGSSGTPIRSRGHRSTS